MNINKLNNLEAAIQDGTVEQSGDIFAGANLIVSNDPARRRYDHDVFVLTPYAEEISWVVFQLKQVFSDEIDYFTKHGFYPALGRAANKAIALDADLSVVQQAIVDEAKDFWSNRPIQK